MAADPASADRTGDDPLTAAILAAALSVVSREGFEGATIRRVAAQAGCSAGAVQKRFATRSQLLRRAFELVVNRSLERIAAATEGPENPELTERGAVGERLGALTFLERQRRAALETLPLDAERRGEGLVWTSYLLRAAVDDTLSDLPRRLDETVHEILTFDIAQAQTAGAVRPEADPGALADALLAMVDGIAIRMLYTPSNSHGALLTALDAGLDAVLAG